MRDISVGKAIGYATLPGILPRVKSLFMSGFGNIALLVAVVYSLVRLLPANHPYLEQRNIGKFGIRHVIAAAMQNLEFKWKNIDQIIVFFALMAGCATLGMFVLGLVAYLMVSPVMAANWFETQWPQYDMAFLMLDQVFGVPGIYDSDATTNVAKYGVFPNNFQVGLQALFQFYSMGLFLLSVFIFLYYLVVVIAETAITGHPFGERFSNVWVPLRVVAALGLLMPWSANGLNTAQYIVLYTAKYGSGMATNTWITYNSKSGGNPLGLSNIELISKPAKIDYTNLIKDLLLIRGCMTMYDAQLEYTKRFSEFGVAEFLVKGNVSQPLLPAVASELPHVMSRYYEDFRGAVTVTYDGYNGTFLPALNFSNGSDIRIVFGEYGEDYDQYPANIFPACGEVVIPVTGMTPEALYTAEAYLAIVIRTIYGIPRTTAPPIDSNEEALYLALGRNYFRDSSGWRQVVNENNYISIASGGSGVANLECFFDTDGDDYDQMWGGPTNYPQLDNCEKSVPALYWAALMLKLQRGFETAPLTGWDYLTGGFAEDPDFSEGNVYYQSLGHPNPLAMDMGVLVHGWGGAGLWYNRIAEKNGSLMAAAGSVPYVKALPNVMEKIKEQRLKSDAKVEQTGCEIYNPNKKGEGGIANPDVRHQFPAELSEALYALCRDIKTSEVIHRFDPVTMNEVGRSNKFVNPILNIINALFGADTFFNLLDNKTTHPMAMLVTLGRTLIDKAIFNLAAAAGTSAMGGINQLTLGKGDVGFAYLTMASANLAKSFVAFGVIAIVSGVMLFYVLPFLPFMYFFFAVGRWVKTIFEAMVGVPLWALAHLSMKGPGLPGGSASTGYFLILEIFIRPVVTVLSLVAAFAVFAGMVYGLNMIFNMAVSNVFGASTEAINTASISATETPEVVRMMRGLVDQLFMTILYVLLVYTIGTGCFKLIDIIPDNILRWSGAGAKSWGGSDNADDLVDGAGRMIALPTYVATQKIGQAITSFGDAAAQDAAGDIREFQAREAKAAEEKRKAALGGKPDDAGGGGGGGTPTRPLPKRDIDEEAAEAARRLARGGNKPPESPAAALAPKPKEQAEVEKPKTQSQQEKDREKERAKAATNKPPGQEPETQPPGTPPKGPKK